MDSNRRLRRAFVGAAAMIMFAIANAGTAMAQECKLGMVADLPVRMEGPRASVPAKVNGKDTNFWLDSGAFFSLMPFAKAQELGLPLSAAPQDFFLVGIGGSASIQIATVKSFGIVGQEIKNVQFLVGGSDAGEALIGLNFLALADAEFDLAHGSVRLIKPQGCAKSALAYWAGGKPYFTAPLKKGTNPLDRHFRIEVSINGVRLEAVLDSGSATSLISRRAAERAKISLSGGGVTELDGLSGLGQHSKKGWSVPVENVSIGDEQILRSHLTVIDGPIIADDGMDMLLGADFMLAHHIYVARSQNLVYFTYNGGKPFIAETPHDSTGKAEGGKALALPIGTRHVEALDIADEPKTGEGFARRGVARLARRSYDGAIADLSEAIRLEPGNSGHYRDRANAYGLSGKADLARVDLEKAISLKPDSAELLRDRAVLRLADKDKAGALADAEAVAKLTPPTSLNAVALATLFERVGQPARAIPIIDPVIASHREDSGLGEMLNLRCWVRALANIDLDKALDDCNRAIKRDGAKAAYLDSRGFVRFRMRDLKGAVADYDAALKLEPNIAWSLYVRGLIKTLNGEDGKGDREAALALQPGIADEARVYGVAD